MKTITIPKIAISSLLFITSSAFAQSTTHSSREVVINDNGRSMLVSAGLYASKSEGMTQIVNINEETLSYSYLECPDPYNPYKNETQDIFANEDLALRYFSNCMSEQYIFDVESLLANKMEEFGASRGTYNLNVTKKIRNAAAPNLFEERVFSYPIFLNKNQQPGSGTKLGARISEAQYSKNIYAVYENSGTIDILDDFDELERENGGKLIIYSMDRLTPEESVLITMEEIDDASWFDTSQRTNDENFNYQTTGVKRALTYVSSLAQRLNSDVAFLDYRNPATIQECAINENGGCLPQGSEGNDATYKPRFDILTTDRVVVSNACKNTTTKYSQRNTLRAYVDIETERYILNKRDIAAVNLKNGNLSDTYIRSLTRIMPFEDDSFNSHYIEKKYNAIHTYPRGFNKNVFKNSITDFLGKRTNAPNNLMRINSGCSSGSSSSSCFDWNGVHHSFFHTPEALVDNSIVNVQLTTFPSGNPDHIGGCRKSIGYGNTHMSFDTCSSITVTSCEIGLSLKRSDVSDFCKSNYARFCRTL